MLSDNQKWMDDIYNYLKSMRFSSQGYYENTIQLLSYLVISGNYWTPETVNLSVEENNFSSVVVYPNPAINKECFIDIDDSLNKVVKVEAITLNGKIINLPLEKNRVNLNKLSKGIYSIIFFTETKKSFTRTIFVE
ncbi:hypothetical protein MNB_SUP05-5-981 [hydrothermal vent metagenome]|uniref:Secretion system C-terminal sorting domain-containing protein n=1 Tax=hydrothermal vent metagenome TaxID=652676 RepID=A0A1W1BV36_9ZZZZ